MSIRAGGDDSTSLSPESDTVVIETSGVIAEVSEPLKNDNEEDEGVTLDSEVNHIINEEEQDIILGSEVETGAVTDDDDISVKAPPQIPETKVPGAQNPETKVPGDQIPETKVTGDKLKSKKTKRIKRPWTIDDFKAYKSQRSESKANSKLDIAKHNPNLYAFLAEDIVKNANSLYYDFDSGYDTEEGSEAVKTANSGKAAGKWSQTTLVSEQEEEPVKEEASRTHWQWDKDGNESHPWKENLPPSIMKSFMVASIEVNPDVGNRKGKDLITSDLNITSWEETKGIYVKPVMSGKKNPHVRKWLLQ